ncbi:MAG: hypothetical protein WCC06_04820 [Candidatus Aminicenantales bacterium]
MNSQTYEDLKKAFDSHKYYFEFFKHITTLDTGIIILMSTLLDKLFNKPEWNCLLLISLPSFMISLVFSVYMMYFIASLMRREENNPGIPSHDKKPALIGTFGSAGFFLIGLICLLIFTIRNLF